MTPSIVFLSDFGYRNEWVGICHAVIDRIAPAPRMVFFNYVDRPGIIGKVGTILGEHSINIATMDVGRKPEGQGMEALMCVTVDSEVPAEVQDEVATAIEAKRVRAVSLPE